MIAYISGVVDEILDGFAIIEAGGLGYKVMMTSASLCKLSAGQPVKIRTAHIIKEDGQSLYGFLDLSSLVMFETLLGVSGIGAKSALGILDALTPEAVTTAVLADDFALLCRAPGVGKKTAQLICLKLKDKLAKGAFGAWTSGIPAGEQAAAGAGGAAGGVKSDAIDALTALGYSRSEATLAVHQTAVPDMSVQEVIKAALCELRVK